MEGLCSSNPDWKQQGPGSVRPDTEALFLGGRMASSVWWGVGGGVCHQDGGLQRGPARPISPNCLGARQGLEGCTGSSRAWSSEGSSLETGVSA